MNPLCAFHAERMTVLTSAPHPSPDRLTPDDMGRATMDDRYDAYCAVDPLFYDSLANSRAGTREYPAAARPAPDGWQREPHDDWVIYSPVGDDLPPQGWKVHLSARLDNAERVADAVWNYCVPRGIGFKFLRGPQMVLMRNAKYAPRGSSGKFVTVYPHGEAELELVCKELDALLAGETGPYILSDLRYGAGPVYVRYGGFAARYCLDADGRVVPAIADPDGTLVPDNRGPVFAVPDWVTLPDFLAPHLAARNATTTGEVPYQIERVIHFSNGGGLYAGADTRTGERVVLKEARPHAGLDATGADAVTRLHRERDALRCLAGMPEVPPVHDEFQLGEHEFLALGYLDGQPLNKELVHRYPLVDPDATAERVAEFTDWAVDVYEQVERAIAEIHRRGLVYGDLHLFNVMVRPDGRIALVDFEVAAPVTEASRPALRNQGFAAPRDRVGFAVDEYALACLKLALFLPLTSMLRLAPGKAAQLADVIAAHFPVPRAYLDSAVAVIAGDAAGTPEPEPARLAGAVLASATPHRDDRLYPGDIEQFHSGGLSLGYGAAGVLWALSVSGHEYPPEHLDWLVKRALDPPSGTGCGLYDGLHGVAYALHALGRPDEAHEVLAISRAQPWRELGADLASGLAGVGLGFVHFGQFAEAWEAATLAFEKLPELGGAGLTRGASGPALLFLRLHEVTGEPALLDWAETALRQDLARCVTREDGALEVDEGWRTMPYLAHGSVGIGLVLDQYLAYRPDPGLGEQSAAILRAARSPFYAQSGLFAGRAGIVAYLATRRAWGLPADELPDQVRRLGWHALPYKAFVAFPGEQLLRLSMDLATGTAGVLLALAMAADPTDGKTALPFTAPPTDFRRAEER
jgi:hypothetical protein